MELPSSTLSPKSSYSEGGNSLLTLSLEVQIDQFHFEEDKEERANLIIQLPDSEDKLDRHFAAYSPRLIIAYVDPSSEEDEKMDINPRKGLKGLLVVRNKGGSTKDAPKSQVPTNLPLLLLSL